MHNQIAVVALAAAALAACSPDHGGMGPRGAAAQAVKLEAGATSAVATDDAPGAVYTLMNLRATAGGGGGRHAHRRGHSRDRWNRDGKRLGLARRARLERRWTLAVRRQRRQ